MNSRDEIAVTHHFNHRVQILKSKGKLLRSFGRFGTKAGEFSFSGEGEYVGMFGGQGNSLILWVYLKTVMAISL